MIKRSHCFHWYPYAVFITFSFILLAGGSVEAQLKEDVLSPGALKKMSVEDLMSIEVTSVSKRPEKLAEVASAIQVITQEDIRRSAATSLPEVLLLSSNLQVAQLSAYSWIISARGFNGFFSNKLLVMIDGRTVYSPLFAGVFWDAQHVLLEDIDRIEVISGPGGTLWGANAVNGVINIITKSAKETPGVYVSGAVGSSLQGFGAVRYGGSIGPKLFYRIHAQHYDRNNTDLPEEKDNTDQWRLTQGGFQLNWYPSTTNTLTVQGNSYGGKEYTVPAASTIDGQNLLARWAHTFSDASDLSIQVYADRTWRRDIPSTISDELDTYDLDFQHRFPLGARHRILWGAGYRLMKDKTQNSTLYVGFLPPNRDMDLFSSFVQDEILLVPDQFKLTLGTKLQHNEFSGFEVQPSARLAWTPNMRHTLWSAVSRAVRAPSRIDVDYRIPTYPVSPDIPNIGGGPNFVSEKVVAYELGYRTQPTTVLSLSLAVFYNQYDDLYSVEVVPGTQTYEIQNGSKGYSRGIELSGTCQLAAPWRLRGGYTYFYKKLENKPGHNSSTSSLGVDPENQLMLQSILNLPRHFQFDVITRYVDSRPVTQYTPRIPSYFTFDVRLAWSFKYFEVSFVGQNLLENYHLEYGRARIPRSLYGKITCRF